MKKEYFKKLNAFKYSFIFYSSFVFFAFNFNNKPLIKAVTLAINGVKTTSIVAILTCAENATGNTPKPMLDGASKLVERETKYITIVIMHTIKLIMLNGSKHLAFASLFNSL